MLGVGCPGVAAQSPAPEDLREAEPETLPEAVSEPLALPAAQVEQPTEGDFEPASDESPERADEREPAPVPRTLDELIPPEAVADPETWALQGAPLRPGEAQPLDLPPAPQLAASDDAIDSAMTALELPDGAALSFDIERELDNFALELPDRIEPDAEGTAFAALALPELQEMADLEEFRLNDTITLAFPREAEDFTERQRVTNRFRELSALAQLRRGEDTAPQIAARARTDADLLKDVLRNYGYYNADVARQLSGGRRSDDDDDDSGRGQGADQPSVRFDIFPGNQYRYGAIDLTGLASVPEPDQGKLRTTFALEPGMPVLADRIISQTEALRLGLGESGYPFADVGEAELLIDHAREEGDLTVPVEPRGRYVFGPVTSSDPEFLSGRHLSRIARFDAGDMYSQSMETDLRRAILATGLVSSVTITPRETTPPDENEPGEVALDVAIERAPLRTITGGIGYGTEDGFKIEAAWEHRNLLPPEGALRIRGILGTLERVASVGFKRNNFRGRDQVLFVDAFASDIFTVAVESRTIGVRTAFERLSNFIYQKEFSWQIGAEALITDERNRRVRRDDTPLPPRRQFTIAGLFGSATIDQSDDLLDPTTGYRATMFLAPETSFSEGRQDTYLRAQLDASAYQSVGSTVLAGRFRAATIQGVDIANVAPSRRLYGGGGASVRGYGFQGVGPRDEFGEATGGAALLEASVEARINTGLMGGAIQIVPFFDIGSVSQSSTPTFGFIRYAAGLGVRYKTSFGPVRVDVGVPLNRGEFDAPVVVFVGLGQAF
ncbi:MAG: BamA/TamA family outer membrane protein [Erythrobacter sp.]